MFAMAWFGVLWYLATSLSALSVLSQAFSAKSFDASRRFIPGEKIRLPILKGYKWKRHRLYTQLTFWQVLGFRYSCSCFVLRVTETKLEVMWFECKNAHSASSAEKHAWSTRDCFSLYLIGCNSYTSFPDKLQSTAKKNQYRPGIFSTKNKKILYFNRPYIEVQSLSSSAVPAIFATWSCHTAAAVCRRKRLFL